ncbi:phage tail protein [Mesorhizobium sp. M0590]|uniref:phage tail protein n=1 Tax=Mesorhizobium sp. M0590 TaxID=2956966 RepID=UPI00333AA95C
MARKDPLRNFRFRLEIGGITQANFSEVAIGETASDVVDYRDGSEPNYVRKLSGLTKFGTVTLKWGMTDSTELESWHDAIIAGQIQTNRKLVTIIVQDEAGADKARFVITDAWPSKYTVSGLNGKGNEVLIESIELVNEGIERVQ